LSIKCEAPCHLGVLLYDHGKNAYWYGSQLSIEETRRIAPYQNATGMQVSSAVLAGMVWALENPDAGIVEADELDFRRCLEIQMPYLGPVKGFYTDWTPLSDRSGPVPGRHRQLGSLAVQERAGALRDTYPDAPRRIREPSRR
jgi:homospermidine synthase